MKIKTQKTLAYSFMIGTLIITPVISTLMYFGLPGINQKTIYVDENNQTQTTDSIDLSNMKIKKITQLGFYQETPRSEVQVVRMPQIIEEVPTTLPPQITSLNSMFRDCKVFNQDLSSWDVSNVTDMSYMFNSVSDFNSDISKWNVSNVTNMNRMFLNAKKFNQDLSDWNVNKVNNYAFFSFGSGFGNDELKQPPFLGIQPTIYINSEGNQQTTKLQNLKNLNTTKIIQIGYFNEGNDIKVVGMPKTIQEVPNELPKKITSLTGMFDGCTDFNQDLSSWDVSNVTNMIAMFQNAKAFNTNISKWNTNNVTNMSFMFNGASKFDQDLSEWNVNKVIQHYYFAVGSGFANQPEKWPEKFRTN